MRYWILSLVVLCVTACNKKQETIPEKQIRSVKCIQVKKIQTTPTIHVNGITQPYRTASLSFRVSGVIDTIPVSLGEIVKEQQVLITLEDEDFKLQLERAQQTLSLARSRLNQIKAKGRPEEIVAAKARVQSAKKSYENAQKIYESQIELANSSIISKIELDKLKTSAEVAYEDITVAKQDLILLEKGARMEDIQLAIEQVGASEIEKRIAEQNLKYLKLKAPFAGTITELPVEIKEFISNGKTVLTIDDLYKIKLEVFVPASQISQVKVGQMVKITIESFQDKFFPGRVSYVAAKSETVSKTFSVEIEIDNSDLQIRSGMFASAEIAVGDPKETILLPPQCLLEDSLSIYVYTLDSSPDKDGLVKVARKNVVLGTLMGKRVEVLQGISENDQVVIDGQHYITPENPVYISANE